MKSEVFNIDCMEGMKNYPDNYFDLAVVDPPYREKNQPTKEMRNKMKGKMKEFGKKPGQSYFTELFRVSKNQVIWGANNFMEFLPSTNCVIFWDKVMELENYSDGELAWTSFNRLTKIFKYIWSGNRFGFESKMNGVGKPTNRIHPTQKPIKLYEWIFKNYAEEGQKILDTHLGSGSSRIAAYNYKMHFTGYEIDKDYFDASEKRFKNHVAQLKMFV